MGHPFEDNAWRAYGNESGDDPIYVKVGPHTSYGTWFSCSIDGTKISRCYNADSIYEEAFMFCDDFDIYGDLIDAETGEVLNDEEMARNGGFADYQVETLIDAMAEAGWDFDDIDSDEPYYLRFNSDMGDRMNFDYGWQEVKDWLDGVVFDDPEVSDAVERIMKNWVD